MKPGASRYSLFAQPLDRTSFVAYFLGAVVPLAALAWVAQRWIRPTLDSVGAAVVVLGLLASIGLLSLASFLALRRTTRTALRQLDRENLRLVNLLEATRALAVTTDRAEVLLAAGGAIASVTDSQAGYVAAETRSGEISIVESSVGGVAERTPVLEAAVRAALETMQPAIRGAEGRGGGLAVAVQCAFGPREQGALIAWHDDGASFDPSSISALSTLSSLVTSALRQADSREAERNFFTHATSLLVGALDHYLDDRADHSRRVAAIANQIAHAIELPEARLERLHFASLLHDIGMLRIRRDHLRDIEVLRGHPELGDEMLRPIRVWEDLAPIVRHHHERWDGDGYPDRLAGESIPIESRIIAVAEAFDSMTSEHSYQPAVPVDEARARLERGAGSQFDPDVVRAFLETQHAVETV